MADGKFSNLQLRVFSGIILGAGFIALLLWLPILFTVLLLLIAALMFTEWYNMSCSSLHYLLVGLIIIPPAIIALIAINTRPDSKWLLLAYFCVIWATDSFAMLGGKSVGGPRLAPRISPNKTWAGLLIGVLGAGVTAFIINWLAIFQFPTPYLHNRIFLILASMGLGLLAQVSDLFISCFKRKFQLKDSGTIIPGHGGVLDRFDSIILTAPLLYYFVYLL